MAAASLALQWSPPPSSPLFDEQNHQQHQQPHHHLQQTAQQARPSPTIAASSPPTSSHQRRPPSSGRPSSGSVGGTSGGSCAPSASYFPPASMSSSTTTTSRSLVASSPTGPSRTPSPGSRSYSSAVSSPSLSGQRMSPQPSQQQRQQQQHHHHHQPSHNPYPQPHYAPQQQRYFPQQHPQQQQQPAWNVQQYHMPPQSFAPPTQYQQQRPQNVLAAAQGQHYGHSPGFQPAYNMAFAPPTMPNQYAWAQYQQMLATQTLQYQQQAQAQMHHQQQHQQQQQHRQQQSQQSPVSTAESANRERASSGSRRPSHNLGYNDSFQAGTPGASYSSAAITVAGPGNRGTLPPGAMPPPSPAQGSPSQLPSPSFHPYRRQQTLQAASSAPRSPAGGQQPQQPSEPQLMPPQPTRQRTHSVDDSEGSSASHREQSVPGIGPLAAPPARTESTRSGSSGMDTGPNGSETSLPHSRQDSASSQNSSIYPSTAISDNGSTVGGGRVTATPVYKKPSPLSRQPVPQEEDDNDTNADYGGSDGEAGTINGRATPTPATEKKKGLSSKLRKALSLTTVNEMQQQHSSTAALKPRPSAAANGRVMPSSNSDGRTVSAPLSSAPNQCRQPSPDRSDFGAAGPHVSSAASISSRRSARPPISNSAGAAASDGTGKRGLFNRKFNSSTDNVSISSTVSSASVMLRKVGNLGKIARRHSLMGLTNMFNKDKEGREGSRDGTTGKLPPSSSAASASALGKTSTNSRVTQSGSGKSIPAAASVSHATVELDPNVSDGSMTPAAHYVRQHQSQMRQQAEAEEKAARERQEAEVRVAEAAAAKSQAATQGKSTDDVVESRQRMIEKEKERLKSKRTWKNRLRVGGGSSVDLKSSTTTTGLETIPRVESSTAQVGQGSVAEGSSSPFADTFPESASAPNLTSHFPQDSISGGVGAESAYLDHQDLLPPLMPAAAGDESADEFETDSLRHWGEGIERSRASAARVKAPKGILKKSASSSQLDRFMAAGGGPGLSHGSDGALPGAFERPFARVRASSYDAPQASPAPGAPMLSALSTTTEGIARMDGVARPASPETPSNRRPASSGDEISPLPPAAPSVPAFGHHHSNSSMPTLTMMPNATTDALPPSVHQPSVQKKRICFTEEHIYHSTWPAHVYDRRGELATCNRLTPLLAQRIKEELNSFKMEEMEVAPSSRIYTHFFV